MTECLRNMKNIFRKDKTFSVVLSIVLSFLFVFAGVNAATTISTNITTGGTLDVTGASTLTGNVSAGGTLTVTGASTFTGAATLSSTLAVTGASTFTGLGTFLGGATTTTLTLLNGEVISNATDGVIQLGGVASTTSLTLLNGETITNATDGMVAVSGDLTVTGSDVTIGAAGVKLTGDGDGALTLLGLGDGSDEDLTINIDDTSDTATISSSTGVNNLTFTGMKLVLSPTFTAAGSDQSVEADATLSEFTGGYGAGVMGNVMGTLAAGDSMVAGIIGKYNVSDGGDSDHPQAGVIGEVGEESASTADAAVMAVLGGDSSELDAGAAYAVRYLNSTAGSKFTYGLDLFSAAIDSYQPVTYATADIRLQNGETISNTTDGAISFSGMAVAPAYGVTNGTTISASGDLTLAQLQAASYFAVNMTSGSVDVDLWENAAPTSADVGRAIIFGVTTAGGTLTITAGTNAGTVTSIAAGGAAMDAVGDMAVCYVLSTIQTTCVTHAQ